MEDKSQNEAAEFKPGDTVRPAEVASAAPQTAPPEPVLPQVQPVSVQSDATAPALQDAPADMVQLNPSPAPARSEDPTTVTWTASEFIDHAKSFDWYLGLAVAAVLVGVLLYALFRDVMTSATPLVAALALGFYGRRSPRQLEYRLDSRGLTIGAKHFSYDTFRSFAVLDEGPFLSLVFLPLKRFGFLTTVYLDPNDEERVLNLVSDYLPLEPRDHDMVDRFMKRIRF